MQPGCERPRKQSVSFLKERMKQRTLMIGCLGQWASSLVWA